MNLERRIAVKGPACVGCNFCRHSVACAIQTAGCIGCGACVIACPQGARQLKARSDEGVQLQFVLDGKQQKALGPVSVFNALRNAEGSSQTEDTQRSAYCGTGGCGSCSVMINGRLTRSCITPLAEGMDIVTAPEVLQRSEAQRIVTLLRPAPHYHPSIFTHGCNYRCELCHNWDLTFSTQNAGLVGPAEAVARLQVDPEKDYWVGISGGEPTLNRSWLLETLRHLRQAAPNCRIQLDTNASLLTPDYIDAVVQAGVTDISPDLKALSPDTFIKVTSVASPSLARRYLENSWNAVRYINARYRQQVFMAVSLPCHPRIHSKAELEAMAAALVAIDPELRVTLIEYQPAFRRRDWPFLGGKTMAQALRLFEAAGLRHVIIQGGAAIPRAVDPLEIDLSSEEL